MRERTDTIGTNLQIHVDRRSRILLASWRARRRNHSRTLKKNESAADLKGLLTVMGTCLGLAMLPNAGCASRPKRDPDQSAIRYQLGAENYRGHRV